MRAREPSTPGACKLQIAQAGTLRDPKTTITVQARTGAVHQAPRSNSERDVDHRFRCAGCAAATAGTRASQPPGDRRPEGRPIANGAPAAGVP